MMKNVGMEKIRLCLFMIRILIDNCDKIVTIDKNDYELIKYYACHIDDRGYVGMHVDGNTKRLHKFLTGTGENELVDHIDSNKLNNCRSNLRMLHQKGNSQNKSKMNGTTSKYIGVNWDKAREKWACYIKHNENRKHLGRYTDEEYASRRRDLYILEHCKDEHFKLNFEWNDEDIIKWKQLLNI